MQARDIHARLFSTCPPSDGCDWSRYARDVANVSRWSEQHGCTGMLVYADNRQVDPWLVSQIILEHTDRLSPLPAVQPVYMHPFAVANRLAAFGHLFGRKLTLNMVAGGFRNDLLALGDPTEHDRRYERLTEYVRIVQGLVRGETVTLEGDFYRVKNLKLTRPLPEELLPEIFLSGSSEAGRRAARELGATPVRYPEPPDEDDGAPPDHDGHIGLRVGIIAREHAAEAWAVAHTRFPPDREGVLKHQLAMTVSDSEWHRKLSEMARSDALARSPYWLVPFENYKTMCPYLVGSYGRVAGELDRYMALGYDTFILDVPPSEDELRHIRKAFERAGREIPA